MAWDNRGDNTVMCTIFKAVGQEKIISAKIIWFFVSLLSQNIKSVISQNSLWSNNGMSAYDYEDGSVAYIFHLQMFVFSFLCFIKIYNFNKKNTVDGGKTKLVNYSFTKRASVTFFKSSYTSKNWLLNWDNTNH